MRMHWHGVWAGLVSSVAIVGCGGRRDSDPIYSGNALVSSSAAGAATSQTLRIVAMDGAILEGGGQPGRQVLVWVDDPAVTDARLMVDQGSGFQDSGAAPQPETVMFRTPLMSVGTRYQVLAKRGGVQLRSNVVETSGVVGSGAPTITQPVGDYTDASAPVTTHDRAAWDGVTWPITGYLVILRDPQGLSWVAQTQATSYAWGDAGAITFHTGPAALKAGARYELTVCIVDDKGWADMSSDASFTSNYLPKAYSFAAQ